jgi:6-phosphogluconolactonase
MRKSLLQLFAACALAFGIAAVPGSALGNEAPGAVFVLTNDPSANAVVAFNRHADGSLVPAGSYPTGGLGSGAGLGSQGAVVVSDDHRFVFAVNAGSSTISSFRIGPDGLTLVSHVPSGGVTPTSVTYRHGLLYVLNAGVPNRIVGFTVSPQGRLSPLPGSARPLSAAQTAPAQISFSADADTLIVTERATNVIDTFTVDEHGLAEGPFIHPSAGPTPFGFALDQQNTLLVSEAGAGGGASTYRVSGDELTPASSMLMTGQRAACWAVITTDGRFGYISNAGTGNISGFALAADGTASLLNADGVTAVTGGNPTDMALSQSGRLLYVRIAARNEIAVLAIGPTGALSTSSPAASIPAGAAGLAAY